MRHGVIADAHAAEQMIRRFIDMSRTRSRFGRRVEVTLCVPSDATAVERRALREAAFAAVDARLHGGATLRGGATLSRAREKQSSSRAREKQSTCQPKMFNKYNFPTSFKNIFSNVNVYDKGLMKRNSRDYLNSQIFSRTVLKAKLMT